MNTKNQNLAKIELDLSGTRFVGTVDLNDVPVRALQLMPFPREIYITNKTVAVDFDGTLFEDAFPEIGKPLHVVIDFIKRLKAAGNKIILWTCRCDKRLDEAVAACAEQGLTFDAVNDNLKENTEKYGSNARKVHADIYIDEKSFNFASLVCVDFPKGARNENA